jgi:hypothetical protein
MLGQSDAATLLALDRLASAHGYAGNYAQSVALQKELLEWCRTSLGTEHPRTLSAMQGYASNLLLAGDFNAAMELGRETLRLHRKVHGDDDPRTLLAINGLAVSLRKAGYEDEALKLKEEAYSSWLRKFGRSHPYTHGALINYAVSLESTGQSERAIELLEDKLKNEPAENRSTQTLAMLSRLHAVAHHALRAEELVAEFQRRTPKFEDAPPWSAADIAVALHRIGRRSEALALLQQIVEGQSRELTTPTHQAMAAIGCVYLEAGDVISAERLLEKVLALRKRVLGASHPETLDAMLQLAAVQSEKRESFLAEALLLESQQGYFQRNTASPTPYDNAQCRRAMQQLVQLYEKSNQPEKATAWKEKLAALTAELKQEEGSK